MGMLEVEGTLRKTAARKFGGEEDLSMKGWWGFGHKASVLGIIRHIDSMFAHGGRQQKI